MRYIKMIAGYRGPSTNEVYYPEGLVLAFPDGDPLLFPGQLFINAGRAVELEPTDDDVSEAVDHTDWPGSRNVNADGSPLTHLHPPPAVLRNRPYREGKIQ